MADKLKEQEEMPAEAPAADPMAGQDPMELLGKVAGMLAASGDQAQHDLAKKILNMLKPETAEEPAAEQEDGEEEKPDEEEKPMESLKRKVAVLELCLAEGVKLSPVQQKAACALTGAELVEFIGDLKGTKPNGQQKPRATGPRPMKEAKGDDNGITVPALADGKALAAWLAE